MFVVWEPVLPTDWGAPSTSALKRIEGPHTLQFWDKGRLLSHTMGERDKESIVWDHISVYPRSSIWKESPPEPVYAGGPVLDVIESARGGIARALAQQ